MSEVNQDLHNESLWQTIEQKPSAVLIVGMSALLLLTLCAFWTSMTAGFIWDDDFYVTKNPAMRSWDGLKNIWVSPGPQTQYYPLSNTAFWIEYQLFGANPRGYHIVNVLLHAISAAMLWILLRRLAVPGAWTVAAIFAIHPVQVESVGWITELKNVLSGVFYFASMLVYLRYSGLTPSLAPKRDPEASNEGEALFSKEWFALPEDPTRLYALAILLFACAILSKSVTATMPAAVLLIVWWKRGKITMDDFLPLIPFFVLGIGMGSFTAWWENHTIGATGAAWNIDAISRCIIAGRAVWFYFAKLLVPYPLIFSYPRWNISAGDIVQYLFPLTVLAALVALWVLRRKIGRGPLAGALFFVGTLVPALGFVNIYPMQYSFVADHFQYLACIGIIALLIGALSFGAKRLISMELMNPAAAPAAVVVLLAALAIRTEQRGMAYQNLRTIWEDTINQTGGPNTTSWIASNNFGVLLKNEGYYYHAERWFNHSLKINPGNAPALYNLGMLAEDRAVLDKLIAARLPALYNAAFSEKANLEFNAAMKYFTDSQKADPNYDPTNFKLAEIYGHTNRPKEAIEIYTKLLKRNPDLEALHNNLAVQLANDKRYDDAISELQAVIEINPDALGAHLLMGDLLFSEGRLGEALREYAEVQRIDPKNPDVHISLGRVAVVRGLFSQAEQQFKLALEQNPKMLVAYYDLGLMYMEMQDYPRAIEQFKQALTISPSYSEAQKKLAEAIDLQAHPEKRPATTRSSTQPATSRYNSDSHDARSPATTQQTLR